MSKRFVPLRIYARTQLLRRQARAWLRGGDDPAALAARCMFHLNRQVRDGAITGGLVYDLKNHLVRELCRAGYCRAASIQIQTMECWGCGGTGEHWSGQVCYKCDGTGVYRQHRLYRFVFVVAGRHYVWHQPEGLVDWDVALSEKAGPYRPGRVDGSRLPRGINELYAAVVYEYLRSRGAQGLPHLGPRLRHALTSAWWELGPGRRWYELRQKMRRARGRIRSALAAVRRLWDFAETGTMPAPAIDTEDDLPF